ncbi:MAG: SurA N-terminal domain-containing protein [Pseudomonadota bacterium]
MISFFRNFFQSKIGLPIFIAFLVLVALAFAASDITGSTFGGISGGDRAALVGDDSISASEVASTATSALNQVRQQDPTLTMPVFVDQGGFDEVLKQLIDRYAVGGFAEKYGLRAGENLVNSEILQIPAFLNLTGEFDQETYQAALSRQGLTDAVLRRDLADGLLAQQLLVPALASPILPKKAAKQYAALVRERRRGTIGLIPSELFMPEGDPTDEQLTAYYSDNRTRFIRPERRVLRYAAFGMDAIGDSAAPSDEDIAARYRQNAADYEASERRSISSFVVPTEEGAKAIVARINGGVSLEAAAREAGFNVSTGELRDQEAMASSTSFAAAEKIFEASRGAMAEPAQGTLGWFVARVDNVEVIPARTLEQARSEIAEQLTTEKSAAALADLSANIEEEVDSGTSLTEVAEAYNLELQTTPPILADGRIFGQPGPGLSQALGPLLNSAFQMEESEPVLDQLVPGSQFIVYEVTQITESAAPPIDEIRDQVAEAWKFAEGSKAAREAADRILEKVRGDTPLAQAMSNENGRLPPADRIDLARSELLSQRGQNVPPPLILLFSMAEGSTKLYEGGRDAGWFVVDLDEIVTTLPEDDDPLLAQTQQQFAQALGAEYTSQLQAAIRAEIGVERNESAIEAVKRQLSGEN